MPTPSSSSPSISPTYGSSRKQKKKARRIAKESVFIGCEEGAVQTGEAPSFIQGSSHFNINNSNFTQIRGNATVIRFGDGQFTRAQICDYIASHNRLLDINGDANNKFLTPSIRDLPRAEAMFDDYQTKKKCGPCFEGTRVALLRDMAHWATGSDESRMYILSGLAGIGKSTVAYTLASRAADLNLLGASFFFSRYEDERKNAKKFFTTISYQLCVYNETFSKAIGDALQTQRGSAAITKGPQEQLQALIVEPLQTIVQSRTRPIIIVVDALDECDEEDWHSVLTGLEQLVRTLSSFKVLLTTRPRSYLNHFFSKRDDYEIFRLQDIEDKVVDGDIRIYLNHKFSLQHVQECLPSSQWCASDEEINSLVRAAGRLFIIASTVVRIVLDKVASNPAVQIQRLLGTFVQDRMPFKGLDEFYTVILRDVVPADCDNNIVDRYRSVVGAIVSIQCPLPITTLVHLIGVDVADIRAVLVNLQSVILLDDDDTPRIYHKSFLDYITDSKLCKDGNLHIDSTVHHLRITTRCFQEMGQHLKHNILGLGTPAQFMSNEDGLAKEEITDEQLEKKIPLCLRYACIYWANHLKVAKIEDTNVRKALKYFIDKQMLHWFEALSLIRKLDYAHRAIRVVLKVLKYTASDFRLLLLDGLRFISKFYGTIKRSALHTYFSALPFTPTNSLLYRRYTKAVHTVCHVVGGPEKWDALVANMSHGVYVNGIKFSLDSTMFVSLSKGVLKVWDEVSGTPIATISGNSFAVANDFSTIASFKNNLLTLYDVDGTERGTTFTTQADILRVAISFKSSRIAAILSDGILLLWDLGNAQLIGSFDKIESCQDRDWGWDRDRLEFSATGSRLVYWSASYNFVTLRNGVDGSFITNLHCESVLYRIALSADGSRIATLFQSGLRLWSCKDGKLIGSTQTRDNGRRLAISSNGSLLATANDWKVTVWNGKSRGKRKSLIQIKVLYLNLVLMTFSWDDTLAITTSYGIKLYKFYNAESRSLISSLSFPGSTALAFSPDFTRLAAGKNDGMVYLWDIRGVETASPSLNRPARGEVTALALSLDCSRVVCGFVDGAVELWETSSLTKQPIAAHKNHPEVITTLGYSPDCRRFASGSDDGTVILWNGEDGAPLGKALQYPTKFCWLHVDISNTVLVVAGENGLVLWDLETLDHIHTFDGHFEARLSFSADFALLAAVRKTTLNDIVRHRTASAQTIVFDVAKCTVIFTFDINNNAMAFLPDNSHLVIQHFNDTNDDFNNLFTLNLADGKLKQGPAFKLFLQLRNMPLWHGIPVSIKRQDQQWYLDAFFSRQNRHVPVLWIPQELDVIDVTAHGHSVIALACENGHIIFLQLPTSPLR